MSASGPGGAPSAETFRLLTTMDQLRDQLAAHLAACDEANTLLDVMERARRPVHWDPTQGRSLRDALRQLRDEGDR